MIKYNFEEICAEIDYLEDMAQRYQIKAQEGDQNSVEVLNQIIKLLKLLNSLKNLERQGGLRQ